MSTQIDIRAIFDDERAKVKVIPQERRPDGTWSTISQPNDYLDESCPSGEGYSVGYGRRIIIEEA